MKQSRYISFLVSLCLLSIFSAASAATDPRQVVIDTSETVLKTLRERREELKNNPDKVYDIVQRMIIPKVDFNKMSRLVLGKYWRKATAEQKSEFEKEFQLLIVRTYATALLEYTNEKIEYPALHVANGSTDVTVQMVIKPSGGVPIPVGYSLYLNDGKAWKVYDMIIDGISLVTNYRSSFSTEIRRASLQGLIDKLKQHNQ